MNLGMSMFCNACDHELVYPMDTQSRIQITLRTSSYGYLRLWTSCKDILKGCSGMLPGQTVRADIRLDIHKFTDVRVELSVQPRISIGNHAPISVAPISARTSAWISVLRISEREVHSGYPW